MNSKFKITQKQVAAIASLLREGREIFRDGKLTFWEAIGSVGLVLTSTRECLAQEDPIETPDLPAVIAKEFNIPATADLVKDIIQLLIDAADIVERVKRLDKQLSL